jgi:cellulose synthase/poly-beta-1,6-N-acetylglucosamine synthase-like glycosyltransferase
MKIRKNSYKIYSNKSLKKNDFIDKITIITVVYNGEETLEKTIKNVFNRDYKILNI